MLFNADQRLQVENLRDLKNHTNIPLVQLVDAPELTIAGTNIVRARALPCSCNGPSPCIMQLQSMPLLPAERLPMPCALPMQTYGSLLTPQGLDQVATYAAGLGPSKSTIDVVSGANFVNQTTDLVSQVHRRGMQIHPYTFRRETQHDRAVACTLSDRAWALRCCVQRDSRLCLCCLQE